MGVASSSHWKTSHLPDVEKVLTYVKKLISYNDSEERPVYEPSTKPLWTMETLWSDTPADTDVILEELHDRLVTPGQ